MGRRRAFAHTELLDSVEKLLLEHGYDGFHLKLLSEHLPGARSTIYQYYKNREEIVAACMKRVMLRTLERAQVVDETEPMRAIRELLDIYVDNCKLHQIVGDAKKINPSQSVSTEKDLQFVEDAHNELKKQLSRVFLQAREEGHLRSDVPLPVLFGIFFQLIDTPNYLDIPKQQWTDFLYLVFMDGASHK